MFAEFKAFLDKIPEGGATNIERVVTNGVLTLADSNGNTIATATEEQLDEELNAIRDFFAVIEFDPRQLGQGIIIAGTGSLPAALAEILARHH